jgi:hypothetical protein
LDQHQAATGGTGRFVAFVALEMCGRLNAIAPPRSSSSYNHFAAAVVEECKRLCSWLVHPDRLPRTSILALMCGEEEIPASSARARAEGMLEYFLNENWVELCKTISGEAVLEDADEWVADSWLLAAAALKSIFANRRHRQAVLALLGGEEDFAALRSRLSDTIRLVPIGYRLRSRSRATACHEGLAFLVHRVDSRPQAALEGATFHSDEGQPSTNWDDESCFGSTLVLLIRQWSGEELPWATPSTDFRILLVFQDPLTDAQLRCLLKMAASRTSSLPMWWCCNVGPELMWKL